MIWIKICFKELELNNYIKWKGLLRYVLKLNINNNCELIFNKWIIIKDLINNVLIIDNMNIYNELRLIVIMFI